MLRRQFIQLATLAGAGGWAAIGAAENTGDQKTVAYRVKGFTCLACAVGLETMLRREKGVTWVKASYPDRLVEIRFYPGSVTESALKAFIADMGFTAEPAHATS